MKKRDIRKRIEENKKSKQHESKQNRKNRNEDTIDRG